MCVYVYSNRLPPIPLPLPALPPPAAPPIPLPLIVSELLTDWMGDALQCCRPDKLLNLSWADPRSRTGCFRPRLRSHSHARVAGSGAGCRFRRVCGQGFRPGVRRCCGCRMGVDCCWLLLLLQPVPSRPWLGQYGSLHHCPHKPRRCLAGHTRPNSYGRTQTSSCCCWVVIAAILPHSPTVFMSFRPFLLVVVPVLPLIFRTRLDPGFTVTLRIFSSVSP